MTATAITLRLAQPADAQAIAAMSRDLIEQGLGWRYRPARMVRLMAQADTTTLVACDGRGGIAGFAVMTFGDERAHLVLLAVRPLHRRRGVGRRMIDWLVESAQVAGIALITLELRAGNSAAQDFYRSLGFAPTVSIGDYYRAGEPAMRMVRVLRPLEAGA